MREVLSQCCTFCEDAFDLFFEWAEKADFGG
jgi:hypothetical protein